MKRNFIYQTGESNKFWIIEHLNNSYTVTWGKIGTEGRTNTKTFNDIDECSNDIEKLIREKTNKGYIEVSDMKKVQDRLIQDYKPMDEEIFWEIIMSLNWDKAGDDDAVLRPAVKQLSSMTIEDIYKFADILSEKLFMLDGLAYATNIGEDSYKGKEQYFSVDYFLYVRCCVVANGKTFFNTVLAKPNQMPKDIDFEALLYLPNEAYNKKTKTENYNYTPKFNFETFSNVDNWDPKKAKKSKWKFWQS